MRLKVLSLVLASFGPCLLLVCVAGVILVQGPAFSQMPVPAPLRDRMPIRPAPPRREEPRMPAPLPPRKEPPVQVPAIPLEAPVTVPTGRPGRTLGNLRVDLPLTVEVNEPFKMDVWLEPFDDSFSGDVQVFLEQTDKMLYEPRVFTLRPGARRTVQARVLKSRSGLAEVVASANGWEDMFVSLDAGFAARLRANNLDRTMESGSTQSFTLDFVDGQGNATPLDAPVTVALQASKARIRQRDKDWAERVAFEIRRGATSSPVIEIQPEAWSTDTGIVQAEVRINYDYLVLGQQRFEFTILPRWWLPLVMGILGGILHGLYQVSKEITAAKRGVLRIGMAKLASSASAGALSYFLANWDILGIQVDTTSLRGFVVVGFLFAYVGVDLVVKSVLPRRA